METRRSARVANSSGLEAHGSNNGVPGTKRRASPSPLPHPAPKRKQPKREVTSRSEMTKTVQSSSNYKPTPKHGATARSATKSRKTAPPAPRSRSVTNPSKRAGIATAVAKFKPTARYATTTTAPAKPGPNKAPPPKRITGMNGLPLPESHPRPSRRIFVFGTGDFGELGLGPGGGGPILRPRRHIEMENAMGNGAPGIECASTGGMHTLVIDESGRVWSWGVNDEAALGRQTDGQTDPATGADLDSDDLQGTPIMIQDLVDDGFRAVKVAAGDSVSIAISDQGSLVAWGSFRCSRGNLGFDESKLKQHVPTELASLRKESFVSAACGSDHVLALTTLGHVYSWGDGEWGRLGRRILERQARKGLRPERLSLRDIVLVGCGESHSFAMGKDGTVYAWGLNARRQTGISDQDGGNSDHIIAPTVVRALLPGNLGGRRVTMISGGKHHTLFLLNDGSVWGCGSNFDFQLGFAPDRPIVYTPGRDVREPIPIYFPPPPTPGNADPPLQPYGLHTAEQPPLSPIAHISAASLHNLAVSRTGIVYSWGSGASEQLGRNGIDTQRVPARVMSQGVNNWKFEKVHAGGQHCLLSGTP